MNVLSRTKMPVILTLSVRILRVPTPAVVRVDTKAMDRYARVSNKGIITEQGEVSVLSGSIINS